MADLPISELEVLPSSIGSSNTLFVAQQENSAYKVDGQTFINELAVLLEANGGIRTIEKTGSVGIEDTYTITYANDTTSTFVVTNGNGISRIRTFYAVSDSSSTAPSVWYETAQTMTTTNRFLWSYQRVSYTDGTTYESPKSVVGAYGEKGNTGSAGRDGTDGAPGAAARITGTTTRYASSQYGTSAPSSGWTSSVPVVPAGWYLWTRVGITFNDGSTAYMYSSARQGVNGDPGAVAFQLSIPENEWVDNAVTIYDSRIVASGYYYVVSPSGASMRIFSSNGIYADDITADGNITFHCSSVPSTGVSANILKVMM